MVWSCSLQELDLEQLKLIWVGTVAFKGHVWMFFPSANRIWHGPKPGVGDCLWFFELELAFTCFFPPNISAPELTGDLYQNEKNGGPILVHIIHQVPTLARHVCLCSYSMSAV